VFLSVFFGVIFWIATLVMVLGIAFKVFIYWKTPAPLKIPTTPAPLTKRGVWVRMLKEVTLFYSLFRSNKLLWVLGILFHYALALILLRHARYFQDPVWFIVEIAQPFGKYAGFLMVIALIGLLLRRIFIDRVRYITAPSDRAMLGLLIMIGVSGLLMKFVSHTDILMVKSFFIGLRTFTFNPLPADPILVVHLSLVATLMLIFPISKLLHAPGVFFSPTRNQVDNPREKRHLSGWAKELETQDKLYLHELDK